MRHMGMTVFMWGAVLLSAGLPAGHAQSSELARDVKTTALMSHGRGRVERGVAALAKGRSEEAARELLGFILFVMTPVAMPGGAPPPAD